MADGDRGQHHDDRAGERRLVELRPHREVARAHRHRRGGAPTPSAGHRHGQDGHAIQVMVRVGMPCESWSGPTIQRLDSRQAAVTATSSASSGQVRAVGRAYAEMVTALHAAITAMTTQPATGWS